MLKFQGIYFEKFYFFNSLGNKGTIPLKIKTSSVAKTKKFFIDSIAMDSFCVMRHDCHVRTMIWCGSNIRFSYKYEEFEKVEYGIFDMVFN